MLDDVAHGKDTVKIGSKEEAEGDLRAFPVGHGEDGGDADSDEVADTITPLQDVNPAEKKKIQIKSLIRTKLIRNTW